MDLISMDTLRYEVHTRHIERYALRTCSICHAALHSVFDYRGLVVANVFYDSSCDCTSHHEPLRESNWGELLESFNRQSPPIRAQLWEKFLAGGTATHTVADITGVTTDENTPEVLRDFLDKKKADTETIRSGFETFQSGFLKPHHTKDQCDLVELSWYAGATFAVDLILKMINSGGEPRDEDFAKMQDLLRELGRSQTLALEYMEKYHNTPTFSSF